MVNCFGYFQFSSRLPRRLSFIKSVRTRNGLRMPQSSLTEYIGLDRLYWKWPTFFCCRFIQSAQSPFLRSERTGKERGHTCAVSAVVTGGGGLEQMKTTAKAWVSSHTFSQRYLLRSFSALCHWATRYKENEELLKDNFSYALVREYQEERQRSEVWKVH